LVGPWAEQSIPFPRRLGQRWAELGGLDDPGENVELDENADAYRPEARFAC
jgi:hypothetical protein